MYWLDLLNGKPLQYFCLENSMNTMKRQLVLPRKIFLGLTLSCAFSLDSNLGLDLLFSLSSLSSRSFHYYINESPKLWQLDFRTPSPHSAFLSISSYRRGETKGENGFLSHRKDLVRCCKLRQMHLISKVRKLFFMWYQEPKKYPLTLAVLAGLSLSLMCCGPGRWE